MCNIKYIEQTDHSKTLFVSRNKTSLKKFVTNKQHDDENNEM